MRTIIWLLMLLLVLFISGPFALVLIPVLLLLWFLSSAGKAASQVIAPKAVRQVIAGIVFLLLIIAAIMN